MQYKLSVTSKDNLKSMVEATPAAKLLMESNYSQIDTWVNNNVTTLAEARAVFKILLKFIKYIYCNQVVK